MLKNPKALKVLMEWDITDYKSQIRQLYSAVLGDLIQMQISLPQSFRLGIFLAFSQLVKIPDPSFVCLACLVCL